MKEFLNRAYRIVNGNADDSDLQKTNIHACLAHVLVVSVFIISFLVAKFVSWDVRKTKNKNIDRQYGELAMWSVSLLINTSTWYEFKHNWHLICLVFLKFYVGEDNCDGEAQGALLEKISHIKSDTNTIDAIKSSAIIQDDDVAKINGHHLYDFDDNEINNDDNEIDRIFPRLTKQKVMKS